MRIDLGPALWVGLLSMLANLCGVTLLLIQEENEQILGSCFKQARGESALCVPLQARKL